MWVCVSLCESVFVGALQDCLCSLTTMRCSNTLRPFHSITQDLSYWTKCWSCHHSNDTETEMLLSYWELKTSSYFYFILLWIYPVGSILSLTLSLLLKYEVFQQPAVQQQKHMHSHKEILRLVVTWTVAIWYSHVILLLCNIHGRQEMPLDNGCVSKNRWEKW